MKVAFTSSDGKTIDLHFGQAAEYRVWEIGPERAEPLAVVIPLVSGREDEAPQGAPDEEGGFAAGADLEDRTRARADAVSGCAIVCTVQIGGPAAAKLAARRIHPMKTGGEVPIAEVVARLQQVMKGSPPPWLRRAMGVEAAPGSPADE